MKSKRKLKKKFVVFLSLYAMFFISYFTLTTLSRYTSLLYMNANVSVAKWDVSIAGEDEKKLETMFIGNSSTYQSYELSVTSKSEIAIKYSAIITNVPNGVQIQVDNDAIYSAPIGSNTITIEELGGFNLEDENKTHNHKLTVLVPSGVEPFENKELAIDIVFTQVDL